MRILWLSHFVPYPPAGGMRQRSYNLLRFACAQHEVDLLAFNQAALLSSRADVDSAREHLEGLCATVEIHDIPGDRQRSRWRWALMALGGFVRTTPYHVNWLHSGRMHRVAQERALQSRYDLVHVDTIGLAPYARHFQSIPVILNHHNVESQMLARRARAERNPFFRRYLQREARKLERVEREVGGRAAMHLVVSEEDERRLRSVLPEAATTIVENGVDVKHLRPNAPLGHGTGPLVFAGQLSWYANREAVRFLLDEVWPILGGSGPERRLTLAGRNPPREAIEAARRDRRIVVTGEVEDMRPYLDAASIYLCPIRTGGGTRLKVLDAFAMGKPLVATKLAVEGLGLTEGEHYLRAESAGEFVTQIERLEGNESLRRKLAAAGRALVEERFSWEVIGAHLQGAYLSAAHLDAARVAS